jgi:Fe-S cluster assembly protein SufD
VSCRLISDNTQIEEGAAAASEPVTITPLPIRERWLNNALDIAAASSESGAIAAVREAALSTAKAAQLPGRKDEAWRQTDFSALLATHMISAVETPGAALIEECVEGEAPGMRMVFVNGFFSAELSDLSALPEGVLAGSLASFESGAQSAALPLLQALPEDGQDKRTALGCYTWAAINQASLGDIACVRIAENVTVEEPLQIIFVSTGPTDGTGVGTGGEAALSHPNLLVTLEHGARLNLMQQYVGEGAYFTNALSRVHLGDESHLTHSYVQEQSMPSVHLDSLMVAVQRHARYEVHAVQMGGRLARLNLDVKLEQQFASCSVNGIALATQRQVTDMHSAITHVSPDCLSFQEQRNAISDRGYGVWRGAVRVPRGSDNSTANQLCRSLLLSDKARVHVTPTLEIATDEVVCTHGATVADLDDEMIFYLQSRGLDRLSARSLMLQGWAREVMNNVPSEGSQRRAVAKAAVLSPEDNRADGPRAKMGSI